MCFVLLGLSGGWDGVVCGESGDCDGRDVRLSCVHLIEDGRQSKHKSRGIALSLSWPLFRFLN